MSARLAVLRTTRLASQRTLPVSAVSIRTYAAPATGNQASTRPPIQLFGVDGTYASALFTAAAKTQSLDSTARALENLHKTFQKDARLAGILNAPTLSGADKQQIISELQKTMGVQEKSETVKNFFTTLAENNRLSVLGSVCEKFAVLMSAHKGEVELNITSASPLDQKIVRQIETAISKSKYVSQGSRLKVVPKVDPSIRGGLIVEIGDRTIDLSVSSKMARMNKMLNDAV